MTVLRELHQLFAVRQLKHFLKLLPLIILFIAVLNEFDANYFGIPFLSFNLAFILIFFWTLKNIEHFGYGFIFLAGIINDVVTGTPLGLSSFLYMLICGATAYFRKITLRPNITKDWLFFLLTISCVNSIYYIISSYFLQSISFIIRDFVFSEIKICPIGDMLSNLEARFTVPPITV